MIEKYLSKEEADAVFKGGIMSVISEKRAGILGDIKDAGTSLLSLGQHGVGMVRDLGIYGVLTGALSGAGYNIVKDKLTEQDPRDEFNRKVEKILASRKRELEDAKWMTKVRGMRDELRRDYKKMTPEEYAKKYNELVSALDERGA